jgi:hypothetical protein
MTQHEEAIIITKTHHRAMNGARDMVADWLPDILNLDNFGGYLKYNVIRCKINKISPFLINQYFPYSEWLISCLSEILDLEALCAQAQIVGRYQHSTNVQHVSFGSFTEIFEKFKYEKIYDARRNY